MLDSIDERIHDIITQHSSIVVHTAKFTIVADCLQSFFFYKQNTPTNSEEDIAATAVRIDSALAEIQAISMMLGPNESPLYLTNTPIDTVTEVIKSQLKEVSDYSNKIYSGASGIFDIPEYKWDSAELEDTKKLISFISNIPKSEFMNPDCDKDSMLKELDSKYTKLANASCFTFDNVLSLKKHFIQLSDIEIIRKIGKGTFSTIYLAKNKKTNKEVAVKFFQSAHARKEHFNQFITEASAFSNIKHPNIVQFHGLTSAPPFAIITEYIDGGSLFHAFQNPSMLTKPSDLDDIALSIAQALLYLHKLGCIHGDVKSLNILLSKSSGAAKLCDFGSCRHFKDPNAGIGPIGTAAWSAPEMLRQDDQREVTPRADVFSFGVMLIEMLARAPPDPSKPRSIPATAPPKLRALIEKCLSIDPASRPPMSEVVEAFKTKAVSFERPSTPDVSIESLDILLASGTKDALDLLGDICAELPGKSEYVLPRLVNVKLNDLQAAASCLRVMRAICRTPEYAKQCLNLGCVALCLRSLEQRELQVRALFLLLSIVRLADYRFTQQELQVLADWPDSDLATLCLMYGVNFNEKYINEFTQRILECHEQLLPSMLCGLRAFLQRAEVPLCEMSVQRIAGVLFGVLQADEETAAHQALRIFSDILPLTDVELSFRSPHLILLGKWVFVKNTVIHQCAVQVFAIIVSKPNLIIDTGGSFQFMIILLHSLPLSNYQAALGSVILMLLEQKDLAAWFVRTQLSRTMGSECSLQLKVTYMKMLCMCAWTHSPILACASAAKVLRDVMDTGDVKAVRVVSRFVVASGQAAELVKGINASRFIEALETADPTTASDILLALAAAAESGAKFELKKSAFAAVKFVNDIVSVIPAIRVIRAAFVISRDLSLVTDTVKSVLAAHPENEVCRSFVSEYGEI